MTTRMGSSLTPWPSIASHALSICGVLKRRGHSETSQSVVCVFGPLYIPVVCVYGPLYIPVVCVYGPLYMPVVCVSEPLYIPVVCVYGPLYMPVVCVYGPCIFQLCVWTLYIHKVCVWTPCILLRCVYGPVYSWGVCVCVRMALYIHEVCVVFALCGYAGCYVVKSLSGLCVFICTGTCSTPRTSE